MSLFCCSNVQPYRPRPLQHEAMFRTFIQWAALPRESESQPSANDGNKLAGLDSPYVIQLVKQISYGALESKRYFALARTGNADQAFVEVTEADLIEANYGKLNSFKNFKCVDHNRFFELNVYHKDAVKAQHWRHNTGRPVNEIDL
ncbi:hypothetical protein GJ744_002695 [Endocarpon pusillum]|uniref:Uncharacterized protein n=1 Tax=Endocarpon pusillum TaxID=364733 RepID=A0A8H7APR8_9EURO|nr:hypothetical protein GJ744_002695 [Endocarpon pusillum]